MESNHVIPRYQRGAVTVWLLPLVRRRGRSRTSSPLPVAQVRCRCATRRWWSREYSNLPLPGFNRPLHHQSFGTVVPSGVPEERQVFLRNAIGMRAGGRDRTGSLSGTGRASSLQDLAGGFGSTGVHLRQTGVENERRTAGGCGQVPL